ncbi:MAG: HPr family phosphocarrier protein [Clostridia bacterium]|nr:HPr family phosphocarrier protein [Clostridia bacterium]
MVSRKVTVNNKLGLHARPAGTLVNLAKKYKSEVKMTAGAKNVNVKSIMSLLSAAVQCGTEVEFICSGEDENEALQDIVTSVEAGLGEE